MLVHKVKAVVAFLLNLIKKAFVCFRRRRKVSVDVVPLTAVGVVPSTPREDSGSWNNWGEDNVRDRVPQTIQEHIESYRSRTGNAVEPDTEQMADFFGDMEPRIKKQKKILLTSKDSIQSRLSFVPPSAPAEESGELKSWEERESGGSREAWGEIENWDTEEMLREKRRQEKLLRKDHHPQRSKPLVTAT